ncbi:hypothetical protein UFOVP4_3 [uncultured Caudovirales phage]|uniref:Uncharacterized protein n=1 Tax=uncultured Caudovirales phage TaxID=2100421 RepID=A0A6J7VKL9_9CAUD|nr:hypothetical protein UFOVP4_3 [uncultured Caudovirales phage]CAB4241360.1 hypothetical protein UFOVP64_56 [uncultured Caudovirales phage]CAB5078971.1 hypothetical protein UFOVP145_12 [uncultured Caudovirales phage]
MARYQNPMAQSRYPTDPSFAAIGSNLATALFGDPEMQAQAQLRRSQMEREQAAALYDQARTTGQGHINNGLKYASDRLTNPASLYGAPNPDLQPSSLATPSSVSVGGINLTPSAVPISAAPNSLVSAMMPQPVAQPGGNIVPSAAPPAIAAGPSMAPAVMSRTVRLPGGGSSLVEAVSGPGLVAEPQGHVVNREALARLGLAMGLGGREGAITPLMMAMLAMGGGDENMRQALVAGGHSPGKDFAANRQAQSNIAATDQYGDLAKAAGGDTMTQAGGTQREILSQGGQNFRNAADNTQSGVNNTADNVQSDTNNQRDNTSRETIAKDKSNGKPSGAPAKPRFVGAKDTAAIRSQISKKYPGISDNLLDDVTDRAISLYQQSGNQPGSVTQAGNEIVDYTPGKEGGFLGLGGKDPVVKRKAAWAQTPAAAPVAPAASAPVVDSNKPPVGYPNARKASDGFWYVPDPKRGPHKYLKVG